MTSVARRTAALALVLIAYSGTPGAAASSGPRYSDAPTPEWRDGPIRYIITKNEDDEFRELTSEEDRRRFIDNFWKRRDPTPDTPGNEFRSQFWKRVREATSLYGKDTTRPGWLTDMGKIHVLFGPPDEIHRDEVRERGRGIITWIYRNSPNIGGSAPVLSGPNQVIAFAQDATGEYRMTSEPTKMADAFEGLPNPQPPMGMFKFQEARRRALQEAMANYVGLTDPVIREAGGPAFQKPLASTMLLSRIQQPPKEWSLDADITTREFFGGLPFRARADFYKTTRDVTQTALTVAVRSSSVTYRRTTSGEQPDVLVYARILDSTGSDLVQALDRDGDFVPAEGNRGAGLDDDLLFQARAVLKPGSYLARLTVTDEVSGKTGTSDTPITVPDFGTEGLSLSTVSLARTLESVPAGAARAPAYVLGGLRIIPHIGQTFRTDEDLAFYYQVYGAERDPATGQPRLNVVYAFLDAEGDGIEEIGRVIFEGQSTEAHGYSIPLKAWPPGSYLLRIEVTDAVTSRQVTREVVFNVVAGS